MLGERRRGLQLDRRRYSCALKEDNHGLVLLYERNQAPPTPGRRCPTRARTTKNVFDSRQRISRLFRLRSPSFDSLLPPPSLLVKMASPPALSTLSLSEKAAATPTNGAGPKLVERLGRETQKDIGATMIIECVCIATL